MDALRRSPLHLAAEARDRQEVARLLAAGAAVDAVLAAGADVTALTTFQTTPLDALASGGGRAPAAARLDIIDRLFAAGCPIDAVDSTGRTALWHAAATGTPPLPAGEQAIRHRVLQHLLDLGADPTIAAHGTQGRPIDAARGLHQSKKYPIVWAEAEALPANAGP